MDYVNNRINRELDSLKNTLDKYFNYVENVYVIPHKNMDFDCLASAACLCELSLVKGKKAYIVTDDNEDLMEINFKKVYDSIKRRYKFISSCDLKKLRINPDKELTLIVDINKSFLIPIQDMLQTLENVVVIDHHQTDEHSVCADYSFIETDMSSASEIVYKLLKKYHIKPYPYLATALYAGIYLDTRRLGKLNEYIATVVSELLHYGASNDEVKKLFNRTNFSAIREEKRIINQLIDCTEIVTNGFALSFNSIVPNTIYSREILGKTADELIENYDVSTSFVIGFVDSAEMGDGHSDIIHVSARSSCNDVSSIMRLIGGGGRPEAAAATFVTNNIYEVINILVNVLYESFKDKMEQEEHNKRLVLVPMDIKK